MVVISPQELELLIKKKMRQYDLNEFQARRLIEEHYEVGIVRSQKAKLERQYH